MPTNICRRCDQPFLTSSEQFTIAEALRRAREVYEEDAAGMRREAADAVSNDNPEGARVYDRLAAQFDVQAAECTALLANQFEDCL